MQIVGFYLSFGPLWLLAEILLSFIIIYIISFFICYKFQFNGGVFLLIIMIGIIPFTFLVHQYTGNIMLKKLGIFSVNVYYTNKNNEKIEVTKDKIINDIVNNKIENNNENLQVYKQAFQISYDEYNLLKPHESEYKNQSEYGNVKIIE